MSIMKITALTLRALLLYVLFVRAAAAHAEFPGVLIDFTRLHAPHGVTDLPPGLLARVPPPRDGLALQWMAVDEHGVVYIRLVDVRPYERESSVVQTRALTVRFTDLDEYLNLIDDVSPVHVSRGALEVLRERRREVGLSSEVETAVNHPSMLPRILQDASVLRQLPPGLEWFKFNLRAVELQSEGRVRLSVSGRAHGEFFLQSVMFDSLEEFNRVSGENVTPDEFARRMLLFWLMPQSMTGNYHMKTRAEISRQCEDLLRHGLPVSPAAPAPAIVIHPEPAA